MGKYACVKIEYYIISQLSKFVNMFFENNLKNVLYYNRTVHSGGSIFCFKDGIVYESRIEDHS